MFLTSLKKLTLGIVNKFPLRSLTRFFLPSFRSFCDRGIYFSASQKVAATNGQG